MWTRIKQRIKKGAWRATRAAQAIKRNPPKVVLDGVAVAVVLVHGTWARGIFFPRQTSRRPRWFDAGSRFRSSLEESLRQHVVLTRVECLFWSGANSIKARDRAAVSLAKRLEELKEEHPDAEQLVIAHSHGGNVALRSIEHLPDEMPVPRIATIATPFVAVELSARPFWQEITTLVGLGISVLMILMLTNGLLAPGEYLKRYMWSIEAGEYSLWLRLLFVIPSLAVFGFTFWFMPRVIMNAILSKEDAKEITSQAAFVRRAPRTLIVRAIDDEASLSLSLGAVLTRVARLIMLLFSISVIVGMPLTAFAFLFFWMPSYSSWSAFEFTSHCWNTLTFNEPGYDIRWIRADYPRQCARDLVQFTLITAPVIFTALMFLLALGFSTFGRELFRHWAFSEINSSSAPDNEGNVVIRTIHPIGGAGGIRHALYDRDECVWAIEEWLVRETEQLRNAKAASASIALEVGESVVKKNGGL